MQNAHDESRDGRPIALVLLDEHPLTRAGVRNVLAQERDIEVVAEADTVEQALRACATQQPDVILVDVDLPPTEMVESIRRLREECHDPAVVVMSHAASDREVYQSAVAGAAGHVADVVEPAELAATIREAAAGADPISRVLAERPAVGRRVLETFRDLAHDAGEDDAYAPSPRQREILERAALGRTNQEIAREMGVSSGTVRSELSDLLQALGLRHRTQAVVHAISQGWIAPPSLEGRADDEEAPGGGP
ncbi:MAG TPA: response regulator transcription factor [Candidatus Limnocylindrales bacterium]|nr:response regulator transcription factor [Candidatus Limnocylindrales bacterium]